MDGRQAERLGLGDMVLPAPDTEQQLRGPFTTWSHLYADFFARFYPAAQDMGVLQHRFGLPFSKDDLERMAHPKVRQDYYDEEKFIV